MSTWTRVKWSEAGQILDLLKTPAAARGRDTAGVPEVYFEALRTDGRQDEAVDFLGQALPRLEVVAWAARTVRDSHPQAPSSQPEARALRAALLFVQDPSEARRRAAYDAAQACDPAGPEALAALAAFFSGGSITPPECPPVPAPRLAAGRFAAAAVKTAVFGGENVREALDRSLDLGAELAREGLKAPGA